jgi:hypothetical protein
MYFVQFLFEICWFNWLIFVKLKVGISSFTDKRIQLEEHPIHSTYSKLEAIELYSIAFVFITFITTILSMLLDILPNHFIWHIIIQCLGYVFLYKKCKHAISKGIKFDRISNNSDGFDPVKRLNDDISCGISPYNYRNETNFNTSSSISSSSYSSTSISSSVYSSLSNIS